MPVELPNLTAIPAIRLLRCEYDAAMLLNAWLSAWFDGQPKAIGTLPAETTWPKPSLVFNVAPGAELLAERSGFDAVEIGTVLTFGRSRRRVHRAAGQEMEVPLVLQQFVRARAHDRGTSEDLCQSVSDRLGLLWAHGESLALLSERGLQDVALEGGGPFPDVDQQTRSLRVCATVRCPIPI